MRRIPLLAFALACVSSVTACPSKPTDEGKGPSAEDKKVPGSKAENPYGVDLVTMCMATETTPKGPNDDDPSARATAMAKQIVANLKTDKGKQFFSDFMGKVAPAEKGKALRAEAKANGSPTCPLADWYEMPREPIKAGDP